MKTIFTPLLVATFLTPELIRSQPEPEVGRQEVQPPAGQRRPGTRGAFDNLWKRADLDGNGSISREEFRKMPRIENLPEEKGDQIFKRLDKDGNQTLAAEEMKFMDRNSNERKETMMRFKELDADQSGGITLAELRASELFKKLPPEKQEKLFGRMDTDGDGAITTKDRPQPPEGRGKPERMARPSDPKRSMKEADANQDGAVSFEEFRNTPPHRDLSEDEQEDRFEALDSNHDKKLDHQDTPAQPRE